MKDALLSWNGFIENLRNAPTILPFKLNAPEIRLVKPDTIPMAPPRERFIEVMSAPRVTGRALMGLGGCDLPFYNQPSEGLNFTASFTAGANLSAITCSLAMSHWDPTKTITRFT